MVQVDVTVVVGGGGVDALVQTIQQHCAVEKFILL